MTTAAKLWYKAPPMIRETPRLPRKAKRKTSDRKQPRRPRKEKSSEPRGLLDRVLERWGLASAQDQTLEVLDRLHAAYIARVPFENVTKLVKAARAGSPQGAMRGPVEFWDEYLRWGSGGTCFAATSAYQFLLRYLGFSSRIIFCQLPAAGAAAHCALLVTLDEETVLVDVGYALPVPIPLSSRGAVRRSTVFYDVEVRPGPQDEYLVFSEDDRGQRFRYRLTLREVSDAELQEAWRRTFRPEAPYMRRLALGRFENETRFLYKDQSSVFEITRAGERARALPEPRAESLAKLFGIPKPLIEAALISLERFPP
jgi:arylamine N-acetyltransferase